MSLFMAHLFIGLVFGLILHKIYLNKNIIIFCAIGSVLPDLVSKILDHLLPVSRVDNAGFYSQTLALFLLFLTTGLLIRKYYHSNSFLCVAVGTFLHKIADTWVIPDWYVPLFGPNLAKVYPGYFQYIFLAEINSVTEWIFFIAIVSITFYLITKKSIQDPGVDPGRKKELSKGIFGIALLLFILLVISRYILPPATTFW
ncbi:MAG: hypothetical protein ABSE07_07595 [Methanoregula sp.]|jgi:hypothetical protein